MYTLVGYGDAGIPFFFSMNQDFLYNVGMAGCACTVGEMNAMLTVLERDRFGGGCSVMVWSAIAQCYRSPLVNIDGNLNVQRYDNAISHTARETVNFLRTNNIDLNSIEFIYIKILSLIPLEPSQLG